MKNKKLLILTLVILGLTSCSNEEELIPGPCSPEITGVPETVYLLNEDNTFTKLEAKEESYGDSTIDTYNLSLKNTYFLTFFVTHRGCGVDVALDDDEIDYIASPDYELIYESNQYSKELNSNNTYQLVLNTTGEFVIHYGTTDTSRPYSFKIYVN